MFLVKITIAFVCFQTATFFLQLVIIFLMYYGSACRKRLCSEPDNLHERFLRINKGLDIKNILMTDHQYNNTQDIYQLQFLSKAHAISRKCPSTTLKGDYPVMFRSTCPWFLDTDTNKHRYPKDIIFANTRCNRGCIGGKKGQVCEKIQVPIKVLEQTCCKHHKFQYEEVEILLPVAYTCTQLKETTRSIEIMSHGTEIPIAL